MNLEEEWVVKPFKFSINLEDQTATSLLFILLKFQFLSVMDLGDLEMSPLLLEILQVKYLYKMLKMDSMLK